VAKTTQCFSELSFSYSKAVCVTAHNNRQTSIILHVSQFGQGEFSYQFPDGIAVLSKVKAKSLSTTHS